MSGTVSSSSSEPTAVLDEARKRGLWGTLIFHFREGRVTHITERETSQPSNNRGLAHLVNQTAAVQEEIAQGSDCELVFVRIRGGKLIRLATERYRNYQEGPVNGREA